MTELLHSREYRQQELKKIIKALHDGAPLENVKKRFAMLIKDIGPAEIANLEQALINEGLPEEEIKKLCDVHVEVFREALDVQQEAEAIPGHPTHTLKMENKAIEELLTRYRSMIEQAAGGNQEAIDQWRSLHAQLMELEKHYSRKENVIFPYLERYGISGPPSVMWSVHDEIRAQWKKVNKALASHLDSPALKALIEETVHPMLKAITEMIYKENKIMIPMCLETLTEAEWEEINRDSDEIGYTLYTPERQWVAQTLHGTPKKTQAMAPDSLELDTGFLTPKQINAMLRHLPVDITFVDAEGKVRYFSQGKERIFTRTKSIIGRQVGMCHPPESVHVVLGIVEEMAAGKMDEAEFWITLGGQFVHIRYFAVRDEDGIFLGVMEVSQDVTGIRALQGEKRLLDE